MTYIPTRKQCSNRKSCRVTAVHLHKGSVLKHLQRQPLVSSPVPLSTRNIYSSLSTHTDGVHKQKCHSQSNSTTSGHNPLMCTSSRSSTLSPTALIHSLIRCAYAAMRHFFSPPAHLVSRPCGARSSLRWHHLRTVVARPMR